MQIVGISAQSDEKIAYSKHTCILRIIILFNRIIIIF